MKKAVIYGAGNIGRGFIGQLFSQSGYEVVFIDVNIQVVEKINTDRRYPIRFTSNAGSYEEIIENVRAVNGLDFESAIKEISEADIMATAVGVNILSKIAVPLAGGLSKRWGNGNMRPLNIIICENLIGADHFLKSLVKKELKEIESSCLDDLVGFVEASIGRMVPLMTPEMQEGNVLRICVEEFGELPVDKDGFKGEIPEIKNLIPFSPFKFYIQRKLFIHNMGHALTAYLGQIKGYTYIWEAIQDDEIQKITRLAMMESAQALSLEHGVELKKIEEHVDDLILRFGNRQLGDTIERVGRDLQRKLSPNDRLIGALAACIKNNIDPIHICLGIAAALHFKDSIESQLSAIREEHGPEEILVKICGLSCEKKEYKLILNNFHNMLIRDNVSSMV